MFGKGEAPRLLRKGMPLKKRMLRPAAAPKAGAKAKAKAGAKAKAKAGAKAAPRMRVRGTPKGGARKRPATIITPSPKEFVNYEKVKGHQVTLEELLQGGLVIIHGVYWRENAQVAARVKSAKYQDQEL